MGARAVELEALFRESEVVFLLATRSERFRMLCSRRIEREARSNPTGGLDATSWTTLSDSQPVYRRCAVRWLTRPWYAGKGWTRLDNLSERNRPVTTTRPR